MAALKLAQVLQHNGIGARLHSADMGSKQDCAAAGMQCGVPRSVGTNFLPTSLPRRERERLGRQSPDMVWVQEPDGARQPADSGARSHNTLSFRNN